MARQTSDSAPAERTGGAGRQRGKRRRKDKTARRRKPGPARERGRADLYRSVTDRIIGELEQGRVPWVQPWGRAGQAGHLAPLGLPVNGATGKTYSGINILLLWGAVFEGGWSGQTWLTFNQARALGGSVRKGETASMVVYADTFIPEAERERAAETGETPRTVGFLKRYCVFNTDQCDGLPEGIGASPVPLPEREIVPQAEALIEATGADFRIGGDRAFYVPAQDFIRVPPQPAFFDQINYYRTCFHELGHWTGHRSRLARDLSGGHGSKAYAREELVAELASAFVCAAMAITPSVRHTDYLATWLEVLREDERAIFRAASLASKAADFIFDCGAPKAPETGDTPDNPDNPDNPDTPEEPDAPDEGGAS